MKNKSIKLNSATAKDELLSYIQSLTPDQIEKVTRRLPYIIQSLEHLESNTPAQKG